jgi:hypothetical protein
MAKKTYSGMPTELVYQYTVHTYTVLCYQLSKPRSIFFLYFLFFNYPETQKSALPLRNFATGNIHETSCLRHETALNLSVRNFVEQPNLKLLDKEKPV